MKKKILITGISGFLGSHIAYKFISKGWTVIGLKRSTSNLWRCDKILNEINWISTEDLNWIDQIVKIKPEIIIHSAWSGVSAEERLNYKNQLFNLNLVLDILEISKICNSIIIGLGSQAEYGTYAGNINEEQYENPNTAYGVSKLMAMNLIKGFCLDNNLKWFWLRLFPIFGEMEDNSWLIPSVIDKLTRGIPIDLTPGDQKYSYLYIEDFTNFIYEITITEKSKNNSGVYNISGAEAVSLKSLLEFIRDLVNPNSVLNFGALQYRPYQSMHMQGDMTKFIKNITKINYSNFDISIRKTVNYYLNQKK